MLLASYGGGGRGRPPGYEAGSLHSHGMTPLECWGPVNQGRSDEPHLQVGKLRSSKVGPGAGTRARPPGLPGLSWGEWGVRLSSHWELTLPWQAESQVKSYKSKRHGLPIFLPTSLPRSPLLLVLPQHGVLWALRLTPPSGPLSL